MNKDIFDRQIRFFGKEGQKRLAACRVIVVGVGGLGTHVVQQLAHLGVGHVCLIDDEELDYSNLNRYVGARHDDPIPGTPKVEIGERIIHSVNPSLRVDKMHAPLISRSAFDAVVQADYVFGCLDNEGSRLVLNELCAAYSKPYFDAASDVIPSDPPEYGGRLCVTWDGEGCIYCFGLLDISEAQLELLSPEVRRDREVIYGIGPEALDHTGPSVISINGVVASLAVTEFMVMATGMRQPRRRLLYHGHLGKVTIPSDPPYEDCYCCNGIWGRGDAVDIQRYFRTNDEGANPHGKSTNV